MSNSIENVSNFSQSPSTVSIASKIDPNTDLKIKTDQPALQKVKNRCMSCNKKIGISGFDCKCAGMFCSVHRYPSSHNCTFDFHTDYKKKLAINNPKVVAEKITLI